MMELAKNIGSYLVFTGFANLCESRRRNSHKFARWQLPKRADLSASGLSGSGSDTTIPETVIKKHASGSATGPANAGAIVRDMRDRLKLRPGGYHVLKAMASE